MRQKARSIAKRLKDLVAVRSLRRLCCNCEQRARGRRVSGERKGTREKYGTRRVGTRLGTRYARMAGKCLTMARMKRGGENNVNLYPELNYGRCRVDEGDQDCMAQKTKNEVDAGTVYRSGYEHSKCPCDVSGGKAEMVGESP